MEYLVEWCLLVLFLCLSAFFSSSETGMMAVNPYRLRHRARHDPAAKRVVHLLDHTDRLLSMILLGNTFANILITSLATLMAIDYWGHKGAFIATVLLTPIILIFAETIPKTYAAMQPEKIAYRASWGLRLFLTLCAPLVWVINAIARVCWKLLKISPDQNKKDHLNSEELQSLVSHSVVDLGKTPQQLMLRALTLNEVCVKDVMIPRHDVEGIDLQWPWPRVMEALCASKYTHLPIYAHHLGQAEGMINVRQALSQAIQLQLSLKTLLDMSEEIYFVPESTPIDRQLLYFQKNQRDVALVVDEYGEVTGFVTIKDIIEEIVGQYGSEQTHQQSYLFEVQKDGSVLVDAAMPVRDLCRLSKWHLPLNGANTLSGLCIDYLQVIPKAFVCLRLAGYPMEVVSFSENTIDQVRVYPNLYQPPEQSEKIR